MRTLFTSRSRCDITLGFILLLGAVGVEAQESNPSLAGSRVRVRTVESREPLAGVLERSTPESLSIRTSTSAASVQVPRADIVALEVSRGVRRHTLEGLLVGGIAWGAIAGLVAAVDTLDESGVGEPLFIGGMLGAGAGIGTILKTERWERVELALASAKVAPRTREVQATVVLRF